MLARTLIKLIDYAIFPAVLIVSVKIVGVIFLSNYFSAEYLFEGTRLVYLNPVSFIEINSYSSLLMFVAVIAGLAWVTIKAHIFHESHIAPSFSAQLSNMNLLDLVNTTEIIYSQAFIWLSYAWLTTIAFGIHAYFGMSYWWLFYASLAVSTLATTLLALDIDREMHLDEEIAEALGPSDGTKVISFQSLREEIAG